MPASRSSTRPARRPRARHLGPDRRRPLVLDAALGVFAARGYAGTSMEAIATAAGITKPVVYECFPSKAALYEALLEREAARLRGQLLDGLPRDADPGDLEGMLRAGYTALLEAAAAWPDAWRLIVMRANEPAPLPPAGEGERDGEPVVDRGRRRHLGQVRELAAEVLAARGVAERDADRLATLLATLVVGLGEAAVRLMLERPGEWEPRELGALLGRFAGRAGETLARR